MNVPEPFINVSQAGNLLVPTDPSSVPALGEPDATDTDSGTATEAPIGIGIDAAANNVTRQLRQDLLDAEDGPATLIGVVPPKPALGDMADMTYVSDESLMAAVTRGKHSALEQLYDRHVRACFGLALKIVRDPSVAEDITQEVFIKIWSCPHVFLEQKGKFMPWLLTVVHHRSVDKLRAMRVGPGSNTLPLDAVDNAKGIAGVALIDVIPGVSPSPYDSAWTNETGRIVCDALRQLPEHQHEAIILAYFEGLTQSEVAAKLDKPLGTVKTHTRSVLRALHELLATKGLLNSD